MRIVVIGGGTAGATAASRAKRHNPNAEVFLIEASDYISHSPCSAPYALVEGRSPALYTPERFEQERGVKVLARSRVVEVDAARRVVAASTPRGRIELEWDKLVVATGSKPYKPPIPGSDAPNVAAVRYPWEAWDVAERIKAAGVVAVVGAGLIGVELADSLLRAGKKVLLFDAAPMPLAKYFDPELAGIIHSALSEAGVELHLGERINGLRGSRNGVECIEAEGGCYKVDFVFFATGARPNVDLVKGIVELGKTGAIKVNEYMETSAPGIYAAGDAVEVYNPLTGGPQWMPQAGVAVKTGLVAGINAALGRRVAFKGAIGSSISAFSGYYFGKAGLTEAEAKAAEIDAESAYISTSDRPLYCAKRHSLHVKVVVDKKTSRIVGVQIVGNTPAAAGYLELAAALIQGGVSIEDAVFIDYPHMPLLNNYWNPISLALRRLLRL
ncbi:MAG: FAD-dependent oxidoreductase [Thermoproteus sp. AZ2]|uniref:FAD-dependent oxidoreductase n=1 Tax=Thermoproteus sp. AZ2 TaxID=1609232 RepID=A0ACC6V1S3_9CREN